MKEKNIDRGHYIDVPVRGDAVRVPAGERLSVCEDAAADLHYVLEAGARLDLCLLMLSNKEASANIDVDFVGEGASANLSGIYVCKDDDALSLKVTVRHRAGNCASRQLFNGIVSGSAKAAFDGRIIVAPDAQKIKAFQENHNLLLSDAAWSETRPQLEIYADDVECSHGATIGKLNEDEQFYMRSRGIPESEAKVLQMISFLSPVLEHVPEERREAVQAGIEDTVRSL
ncbi:MAG: SufD family Fe-S cluster assembly protein [Bacteroidia bacterium]|nr:SufD family Fe-S cluster assembly protein [Bacteroidia bacterium]